jgi:hypothetical protein
MTPATGRSRRSARAALAALLLTLALPVASFGGGGGYQTPSPSMMVPINSSGAAFTALINSGESPFGILFEGLPDGIGVVPGPGATPTYVDLYVNHEQSHVPFGLVTNPAGTAVFADGTGLSDPHDSSVTRVRVDLATKSIIETEVVLPSSAGFIRFCSNFVVSGSGFAHPVLFTNEESNDALPIPNGATYGIDPSLAASSSRQAGYTVALDTVTGDYMPIPGMGRHNHENQVLIPGGWHKQLAFLSGDDTFTAPGSQLYMYLADDANAVLKDKGHLYGFQVNAVDGAHVSWADPFNNANDYLDLTAGHSFSGRFVKVPDAIAEGTTGVLPQTALENWSNENNIFQFIRVEDIAYDPDNPRVVYFADTGSTVQHSVAATGPTAGRMIAGGSPQRGRVFQMVLNASDPKLVDSLTILADGNSSSSNFVRPDNIAVGRDSIMIQEDNPNSRLWKYSFGSSTWNAVAIVDSVPANTTINDPGENSGIIDMSPWLGAGWWALDVQAHQDANQDLTGVHVDQYVNPTYETWAGGPIPPGPVIPPGGNQYRFHREKGQLLFMYLAGS